MNNVFKVGDFVAATKLIHRVDNRSKIYPGGPIGVVIKASTNTNGVQIIDIQVGQDKPICDLVVSEGLPLKSLSKNE
jgi:hypothetical protein